MAVPKRHNLPHSPLLCSTLRGREGEQTDRPCSYSCPLAKHCSYSYPGDRHMATQTQVTSTAAEPENQPVSVPVAPIQKKKYRKKSVCLVRDDDEPGPSREQEEEAEQEIITESPSLSEV